MLWELSPAQLGPVLSLLALPSQRLWVLSLPFLLQAQSLICHLFPLSLPDSHHRQCPTPAPAMGRSFPLALLSWDAPWRVTLGSGADVLPAASSSMGAPIPLDAGCCTHWAHPQAMDPASTLH